ncbi:MAG: SDR family oxidoreductase [Phycisphaerae bacterium]|jgi:nucleoside-diphosphate-sugar epimerase
MAKVLVTGGAGFIGSHLATHFVERGDEVRVIDNFATGRKENLSHLGDRCELITGDIRDLEQCLSACDGVEFVFHEAAIPSVPKSVEEPQASHDTNVNGTFNVLRAAAERKVRRVIYAGSSSVYGDSEESPKHEEIVQAPLSPYAAQKCLGEHYCRAFSECFGLETITLRYFNVFGSRQDPSSQYAAAIPAFAVAILKDEPPTVYGDGEQTRDFTYVDNVVYGNVLAMQADRTHGEAVNIACGDRISVNQVIGAINVALGKDVRPRYEDARPGDVKHSCADITRAETMLGFKPQVSFEEGLRRAIDHYRQYAG